MLYIIKEDNFLADYILEALAGRDDIVTVKFARTKCRGVKKAVQKVIRFVRAIVYNRPGLCTGWFFPADFLRSLRQIGAADSVLFFSCQNLKELLVLDKEVTCRSKSVFLWNPLSTINHNLYSRWEYARYLHRTGMRVCTFDEGDARAYGFEAVPQVYRHPDGALMAHRRASGRRVFFVGKDKRRSRMISDIIIMLGRQGIGHDFHILRDKNTVEYPALKPYYTDELMPYRDYCAKAMQAGCMLEILQTGQTGMTMRTLEALFFNTKLITTNAEIRNLHIYSPANIYVLDGRENRTIRDFLDCDCCPLPRRAVEMYGIEHWIKMFL